jgi:hypothetical protein
MQNVQEKPPFVTFEREAVEDRAQTIATGKYSTKDVAFARVTRPGSRDTLVVEAENWLKQLTDRAKQGLCPETWPPHFKLMFEQWKSGEEPPVTGTAIKGWQMLSPAAQKLVIQAGFRTVEDVAAAGDAELAAIGMGAVEIRNKARAWLEAADGPGKLAAKLDALQVQLGQLLETNKAQAAELARYKAEQAAKVSK